MRVATVEDVRPANGRCVRGHGAPVQAARQVAAGLRPSARLPDVQRRPGDPKSVSYLTYKGPARDKPSAPTPCPRLAPLAHAASALQPSTEWDQHCAFISLVAAS